MKKPPHPWILEHEGVHGGIVELCNTLFCDIFHMFILMFRETKSLPAWFAFTDPAVGFNSLTAAHAWIERNLKIMGFFLKVSLPSCWVSLSHHPSKLLVYIIVFNLCSSQLFIFIFFVGFFNSIVCIWIIRKHITSHKLDKVCPIDNRPSLD